MPLRSGNSWMSVAPFRDLEAEPAARRRRAEHVHVQLPALGVSLHVWSAPSLPRSPRLPGPGGGRAWLTREPAALAFGPRVPTTQAGDGESPLLKRGRLGASERPRAAAAAELPSAGASSERLPCSPFLGCFRLVASWPPHPLVSTWTPRTHTRQGHRKPAANPSGQRGVQKRGPIRV